MFARFFKKAQPVADVDLLTLLPSADAWTTVLTYFKCENLKDLEDLKKICTLSREIGKRFLGEEYLIDLLCEVPAKLAAEERLQTAIASLDALREGKSCCPAERRDRLAKLSAFVPGIGSLAYSIYEFALAGIIKKAADTFAANKIVPTCIGIDYDYLQSAGTFDLCDVVNMAGAADNYHNVDCDHKLLDQDCYQYYLVSFHNAIAGGVFVASFLLLCAAGVYAKCKKESDPDPYVGNLVIAKVCNGKLQDLIASILGMEKRALQNLTVDDVLKQLNFKSFEIGEWRARNGYSLPRLLERVQRMQQKMKEEQPKRAASQAGGAVAVPESKTVPEVVLDMPRPMF